MIVESVKLIPIHQYSYRHKNSEEGGVINGIVNIKPKENDSLRLCYSVIYEDGFIDYVPISEVECGNWLLK